MPLKYENLVHFKTYHSILNTELWPLGLEPKYGYCIDHKCGYNGATTFSITTPSIKGLFVTLSINDTQHNTLYRVSIVLLSVTICVLLC
jgi:hypothetical protein